MLRERIFIPGKPLVAQMRKSGFEFDQQMSCALEMSASRPDVKPEDTGFPDSYLTMALYRLNSVVTRRTDLSRGYYNLFHEYRLAPRCSPEKVVPGRKLCDVLNEAAAFAAPDKIIGVGHFFKAIAALSLDERPDHYMGAALHRTFSVETLLIGAGHGPWTDLSDAPEVAKQLEVLAGRTPPVQDHQYILAVQQDRLVFRVTSVLDDHIMRADGGVLMPQRAILTHFKDSYCGFTSNEIEELEALINDQGASEAQFQAFFERHTHFLRRFEFREVYPHVYLARGKNPLVPDFILTDRDCQRAAIVELKLPGPKLVRGRNNRRRFADSLMEARSQLLRYRDWFRDASHRERLKPKVGMGIFEPHLAVIIGRSSEFEDELDRQQLQADMPDIEVVTYDDIVRFAARRRIIITGQAEP